MEIKIRPRIIPVLLYEKNGLVKTTRFKKPVYVGDPVNTVKIFNDKEADELFFLDIEATRENRKPRFDFIKEIAGECFMPLCYGGGVSSLDDIEQLVKSGIEKVSVNSMAVKNPSFIYEAAKQFASSTLVVSVDVSKDLFGNYCVYANSGQQKSKYSPVEFVRIMENSGAGEILLTSIDKDGTQSGYDLKLIQSVSGAVNIPVVANGGAATVNDLLEAISSGAAGAAAGSMFVFTGKHRAVLITFPDFSEPEGN